MSIKQENNQRVAKNTIFLYIRMLLVMLVSLYTVRVVLQLLGEEDYGIYNVIGGFVVMFSFLSRTLASASQRYFAYELGKSDINQLSNVFNLTVFLYLIIVLIILLLAETVGLWFVHSKLTIPDDRMNAVGWIYQFSIISFCIGLLTSPYQAIIIAHEQMDVYAFVGVFEALLSLAFAYILQFVHLDRLVCYGFLMMLSVLCVNSIYVISARRKHIECKIKRYWNKELAKELISYSGWNMYGALANVVRSQGINVLINMFFDPAINAARGLAYHVNNALNSFASNFYTAVRPQVTKYYAQGEVGSTMGLVFSSSKLSYFLVLFIAVPVMVFASPILGIWLVETPKFTELFLRLVIIVALIDSLSNPLMTLVQATGKVKTYQLVIGSLLLMNLPFSWLFLQLGMPASSTMYVAIAIAVISLLARLKIIKSLLKFSILCYYKEILSKVIIVTAISVALCFVVKYLLYDNNQTIVFLFISLFISILLTLVAICYFGLNTNERKSAIVMMKNIVNKK